MLYQFKLPNGHELYTDDAHRRGVIVAPFGCTKVMVQDRGDWLEIVAQEDGIFTKDECLEWLGGAAAAGVGV